MIATAELLPLTLRPATRVTVTISWPRYPRITRTGKVSKAKGAGRCLPWLSHNVVHNLVGGWRSSQEQARRFGRVQPLKVAWGGATTRALGDEVLQLQHQVLVEVRLYRNPANAMDQAAIFEGVKPLVDALVKAGVLQGDGPAWVIYDPRSAVYHAVKGEERVELLLRRPE